MDNRPNDPDMDKIEKLRKELIEHHSDPFKPFFEITERARERQKAEDARRNPTQRQKITIGKFGWGLLLLLVVGLGFGGYKYFNYRKAAQLRQATEKQKLFEMVGRYGAVSDWRPGLEESDEPSVADVRDTLIRKDNHPLVISAYLREIAPTNDTKYVHFAEFGSPDPKIDFVLECTGEQIAKLRQQSSADDGTEFVVIAAIASVDKLGDSESGADDRAFVAKGRCLDFLAVNY